MTRVPRLALLAVLSLPLLACLACGCATKTTMTGEKSVSTTQK